MFVSEAVRFFEKKDSCIIKVNSQGKNAWKEVINLRSYPNILVLPIDTLCSVNKPLYDFWTLKLSWKYAQCFLSQLTILLPTLDHLPGNSFSHQIFISHIASFFELKDSCTTTKSIEERFSSRKSIPCILTNLNPLLNYPVVVTILLIYNMVPVNGQYQITWCR